MSSCDKLHNLSATRCDFELVGDEVWERFSTGWEDQVWYYRSLLEAYDKSGDERVVKVARRIRLELEGLELALRDRGYDTADAGTI